MKRIATILLATIFILCMTACGETADDTQNDGAQDVVTTNSTSVEEPNKLYKYKAYGMQNVMEVPDPIYEEEYNRYNVYFAKARCPMCNEPVDIDPYIAPKDFGKQTIIWEDSVCCMKSHSDRFFNGWFDVAVQFVRVEE